jgi:dolichol-phosphate mannosyltransferase
MYSPPDHQYIFFSRVLCGGCTVEIFVISHRFVSDSSCQEKNMNDSTLTIILPTYNESENILPLIKKILDVVHPLEILVVDDYSPDNTQGIVNKFSQSHPPVKIISNNPKLGLTQSIQTGIDNAKGKYIAWMDADFSHPPSLLPKLLEAVGCCDIAIGSWLVPGGCDKRKEFIPKLFSNVINKMCQILFGTFVHAYTSGFIMTKKSVVSNFRLRGAYGEYCIDLLVRSHRKNRTICEIPFDCISRKKGKTKTAPDLWTFIAKGFLYVEIVVKLVLEKHST